MLNFNPKYSEYWTEYDNQQSTQTPVFGRMFMVTTLFVSLFIFMMLCLSILPQPLIEQIDNLY